MVVVVVGEGTVCGEGEGKAGCEQGGEGEVRGGVGRGLVGAGGDAGGDQGVRVSMQATGHEAPQGMKGEWRS